MGEEARGPMLMAAPHHHPPPSAAMRGMRPGGHERENLRYIIQQWNANRLDLFEISEPDENLEFNGVMRFYFQDSGQKVATKCIRVASAETTKQVIATLVEKFRPDMRMLSAPSYMLYEIHENGVGSPSAEERRLADDEKPLLVQLNWNKDDREGRFLLRRMDLGGKFHLPPLNSSSSLPKDSNGSNFIRKLSRREKKDLKKQEKQRRAAEAAGENSVAEKLYTELPETSFTRSISNPEAVMRRRRAQKLEKKLQQFRSKDGGPDTGGTLKIYGSSLCPDVPYKTLLLSVRDTAQSVVKEMLEKYGLYRENPANYCLIQAVVTAEEAREGYEGPVYPQKEYILDDDECPLAILMNHSTATGSIMFHVRRRPADHGPRKRKKKPLKGSGGPVSESSGGPADPHHHHHHMQNALPVLVELGPEGNELGGSGLHHVLQLHVTEVGSERSGHASGQVLQLFGPDIQPRHCVLAHTEGVVTVTPCSRDAETAVNGHRIVETTILKHGSVVRFGRQYTFRFLDPKQDPRLSSHLSSLHHHQHSPQQPLPMQPYPHDRRSSNSTEGPTPSEASTPQTGGSVEGAQPGAQKPRGQYERFPPPRDPILPAVLEFREDSEETFFHNITTALDPTHVQFKLAPTYTLYMAARFRASTHYRPELPPLDRAQRLTVMMSKVAALLHNVIQSRPGQPLWLAFWLANCSELLHFLKQDRHIAGYSLDAQDRLAEVVQIAFRSLVGCMQTEMEATLPLLLEDRDDAEEEEGCTAHVLSILTNTMALLRRCRVNAALTIQLFSQLFHFLNMWVFNRLVQPSYPNYCTKVWGARMQRRLARIEAWAEKQGLELAADCHLARLSQAATLLTAAKSCPEDIASISSSCFKLNSLQLRALLDQYEPDHNEPPIPHDLRDSVVAVAESTADGLAREDGREVRLEEDYDLQLPFLLPEDGYSCDIVRGVPSGLAEFLLPLQNAGLCRMNPQPTSSGYWTIYMHDYDTSRMLQPGPRSPSVMSGRSLSLPRGEPEVHKLHLQKTSQGMGLSIVATRGLNQDQLGIYIKSVVPGGSADQDGRLQAGDQLLSVDGRSLVGISQERAAEYMKRTGQTVVLEVARQGAFYHGLATVLEQPSPQGVRPPIHGVRRSSFSRYEETRPHQLSMLSPASCASSRSLFVPPQSPDQYQERLVDWGEPPAPSRPPRLLPSVPFQLGSPPQPLPRFTIQPQPATPPQLLLPDSAFSSFESNSNVVPNAHRVQPQVRVNQGTNLPRPERSHLPPPTICASLTPSQEPRPAQCSNNNHLLSPNVAALNLANNKSNPNLATIAEGDGTPHESPRDGQEEAPESGPPARPASERDISSKMPLHPLLRGPPPAAHLQPRMQPAKSVPALNSELSLSGELSKSTSHDQSLLPHPPPHHPQDIFNPNYSRTSSSNSLTPHHTTLSNSLAPPALLQHPPHHLQHQPPHGSQMLPPPPHQQLSMPLRSRSTQNLSDNDDRHYQNISFHAAAPHRSPLAVQPAPQLREHPAHQPRPASALLQRDEPGRADPSFRPDLYRPASQRDLRPQEPRLVHLPEEGPNGQLPPASLRHPPLHQQSPGGGSGGGFTPTKQAPPPTAPKPKPLDRSGQQPHAFRPPLREEGNGYRDSPPPPPPPTSTHPLLQGSSSNEPTTRQPFFSKTSAWEREEKERYEKRRREAARQWRDEQISQLERQPHKTPQEEERLKTLQLEREFELRAKQADEEEENSDDEDDERITSMATDTRTDEPMIDRRDQTEKEAVRGGVPRGGPGFLGGVNGGGPADEERAKRADEIRRKQQELEVASEVEQKLLREAQRRQEEEANARRYQHQQQQYQQFKNNPQQASQRLDSLVGAPANNEFTNGPMNGLRTSNSFEQNFNNGNINPPPPERNSSYNVMQQQQQQQHHQYQQQYSSSTNNARLRNPSMESSPPSASNMGTVKRVQFSESHHTSTTSVLDVSSSSTVSFDANANKEDRSPIKYNPNDFINEAENMLNFSPSPIRNPGSAPATPGVIGAQEVYRDPRVKRLQEKQALQAASSNRPPVPETLTFREKMKMFAAETGEPETPKDRTKISRAQREID